LIKKKKILQKDTIIALSTPFNNSAIAIIRISGKNSIDIISNMFKNKNLYKQKKNTIHFGYIHEKSFIIDEVLISIFKSPNSFTKENCIEISCHGSIFIIKKIIQLLVKNGGRIAKPGEFTKRAFLNGRFDLSQAEAISDLISCESFIEHKIFSNQIRGDFSLKIKLLRKKLINLIGILELELDFSEENIKFANKDNLTLLINNIINYINPIIKNFKFGNFIKKGIPVVIIGKTNSGKSTLLNALSNEDKSIVSNIPGTTRDIIEDIVNIKGTKFRFIDTAGIRSTKNLIEKIGINKTKEKIKKASVIIYIIDLLQDTIQNINIKIKKLKKLNIPIIKVINKIDLIEKKKIEKISKKEFIMISAYKKINLNKIKSKILNTININNLKNSNYIITNERHYDNLLKTKFILNKILVDIKTTNNNEIISLEIRRVLNYLGEITGEITTDNLLDNIFSKFCIGK